MRVFFVCHPYRRAAVQRKIEEFILAGHAFKQAGIILNDRMSLNEIYMKHFGRNQGKVFTIRNGKIDNIQDLNLM